jgi:Na+-translocating ferredoxin:NAD+ oxidoreductase RnfD subunit
MSTAAVVGTLSLYPHQSARFRLFALWYFTALIIAWNVAGHTILGFEQAWAHPLVAVGAACLAQWLLEWVDACSKNRRPRYTGGAAAFLNFFPPAIIAGLACGMLLYPNERLWPTAFAAVLSIASKVLFRAPLPNGAMQHVFNPSNFGIVVTLYLFPWVGQAPPYQFTENLTGLWHWGLPAAVLVTGIVVHGFATGRLPLCLAWIGGFVLQGLVRSWLAGNAWYVPLMPMSSAAFILFTLYMVPDPATTPLAPRRQVVFGLAVAAIYGALQMLHLVYGLFLALTIVCALRGLGMAVSARLVGRPEGRPSSETAVRVSTPSKLAAPHLADQPAGLNPRRLAATPEGTEIR